LAEGCAEGVKDERCLKGTEGWGVLGGATRSKSSLPLRSAARAASAERGGLRAPPGGRRQEPRVEQKTSAMSELAHAA
jgi:hypothetical protein